MSSLLLSIFRAFVDFKVEVIVMAHISLFFIFQTFDFVFFFYWPLGGGAPRAATQYLSRLRLDSCTRC